MKAITLRNFSPEVARIIQQKAKGKGESMNKTILGLLTESLGIQQGKSKGSLYHDLDSLLGAWDRKEAEHFDQALAKQRHIDTNLWE